MPWSVKSRLWQGFRDSHVEWFRVKDPRGIYAYDADLDALSTPILNDNQAAVILDECCEGCASLYDIEGTLTISGMFSWLETGVTVDGHHEPRVKDLIDHEWLMYLHHQRRINDKSNLGWLRNMLYSVTQQVMRQDLGHWLAYVAARLHHCPTLISFPYYAKYVFEEDSGTGFIQRHRIAVEAKGDDGSRSLDAIDVYGANITGCRFILGLDWLASAQRSRSTPGRPQRFARESRDPPM